MSKEPGPESALADDSVARARVLHLAEGILVALRRCSPEQALAELVAAGREEGLSTYALSGGLVAIAGIGAPTSQDPAARAAQQRWGPLLPTPSNLRSSPMPEPSTPSG